MRLIPAIDIIDGQCVRLSQGDYNQKKVYNSDPLVVAKELEQVGFRYLHLVDLDGAKAHQPQNLDILRSITRETNLKVDFGGGIKTKEVLDQVLEAGAIQANIGSLSAKDPDKVKSWMEDYGSECIIIGADVKDQMIAINGWLDTTELSVFDFIQDYVEAGASYFVCTDIAKDGMMSGSSIDLYKEIKNQSPNIKLIASGGVASISECQQLKEMDMDGVILGKSLYEGQINKEELIKTFINAD